MCGIIPLVHWADSNVSSSTTARSTLNGANPTATKAASQLHIWGYRSGAADVIDYATADFAASRSRYDIIVDTVGNATFQRCRPAMAKGGRLLLLATSLGGLLKAPLQSKTSGLTVAAGPAAERAEYISTLAELCEAGAFKPVIDQVLPFARIADAHARVDTGRKVGSVVVTFRDATPLRA